MKTYLFATLAFLTASLALAAEMPSLKFGGEKIGVPPLSLAENLAQNRNQSKPPQNAAPLPRFATGNDGQALSPNLVPRNAPDIPRERTQARSSPRVTLSLWSMPIIEPGDAVDYKMRILPVDPKLDAKMIIRDPTPKTATTPPAR